MPSSPHHAADEIEPLDAVLWATRIELMAKRLADETLPLEPVLRHVFHLVQLAPLQSRRLLAAAVLEDPFESLLEAGCFDAAALALAGRGMNLSIRRAPDTRVAVTVAVEEKETLGCGEGTDLARAFLRAYCRCVTALAAAPECPAASRARANAGRSRAQRSLSTH